MIRQMGMTDELLREEISLFEHGVRVPPLPVLLEYARAANVYVDALIDDAVDLPEGLPAKSKTEGVKRTTVRKPPGAVSRRALKPARHISNLNISGLPELTLR